MEKFTVEEFRVYLRSQDSLSNALFNLTEKSIKYANAEDESVFDFEEDEDEDDNWYLRQQEY